MRRLPWHPAQGQAQRRCTLGTMRLPSLVLNGKVLKVEDQSPVENFALPPAKATA